MKPKRRILVIEDNPGIVKVYKHRLSNANYIVDDAASGKEALEKISLNTYDCILCDVILLEGESGKDIAYQLRQSPKTSKVPIIFLTSTLPFEQDKGDATITVGIYTFRAFAKPLHWPKLISAIRKEINRSKNVEKK